MTIQLGLIALVLCGVGAYLLIVDFSKQQEMLKTEQAPDSEISNLSWRSKQLFIYGIIMTLICIGIAVSLAVFNPDNTLLNDIRRICLLSILWPVAYIDYKSYRIPNMFTILGCAYRVIIFVFELIFESDGVWQRAGADLIACAALAVAAILCALLIKNSLGFGDVKLLVIMGLLLGLDGIWSSIFMSLIISFVISIVLLITKKKGRKDVIPFAPAIMIGTYISVFLTGM